MKNYLPAARRHDRVTVSVAFLNKQSEQGKSTLAQMLAYGFSVARIDGEKNIPAQSVCLLDGDVVNPQNGEPTLSGRLAHGVHYPFAVYDSEDWQDVYAEKCDVFILDGSRQHGDGVQAIANEFCVIHAIPIANERGYEKAISAALQSYKTGKRIVFILQNSASAKVASDTRVIAKALRADVFQIPTLDGIEELFSNGGQPQQQGGVIMEQCYRLADFMSLVSKGSRE